MPMFTVLDVSPEVRRFPSQHGEMTSYRLHLRNGDGTEHLNVELVRKATSAPPVSGSMLEGDIENREKHGLKLNLVYGGGGGGGSRPEDPLRQKRIVRQHSQSMALQTIKLAMDMHLLKAVDPERPQSSGGEPETTADLFALIAKTADWFDADVERAAS